MTVGRWAYQERSCKEIEATRKSPRKTSFKNITGLLRKNEFCWVHARTVTDAQAGVGWEVHVGEEGCPPFSLDLLFYSPVPTSFQLPTPAHPPTPRPLSTFAGHPRPPPPQTRCCPPPRSRLGQAASSDVCVYPFICVFLLNLLMCVFVLHESDL